MVRRIKVCIHDRPQMAALAKCSHDTALRDIDDLLRKGVLRKDAAGGRSTSYSVVADP